MKELSTVSELREKTASAFYLQNQPTDDDPKKGDND